MIDDNKVSQSFLPDFAEVQSITLDFDEFRQDPKTNPVHAFYLIGKVYSWGLDGKTQDIPKGIRYLEKGAELGSGFCAEELAGLYGSSSFLWSGKPSKDICAQEAKNWQEISRKLLEWEATNNNVASIAYHLYHIYRISLGDNNPPAHQNNAIARKWKLKTIEFSKIHGEEFGDFIIDFEKKQIKESEQRLKIQRARLSNLKALSNPTNEQISIMNSLKGSIKKHEDRILDFQKETE